MSDYQDWRPEPIPAGWYLIPTEARPLIESELRRSIGRGHRLDGYSLAAVAKCVGCDETLVFVNDETRWAFVHLTYRGEPETPPWPRTSMFWGKMPIEEMREHAAHVTL